MGLVWSIAAVVFCLDLITKTYLRTNFLYVSIPVIKNIFHITVIENTGAAFGILQGRTNFLIYIGLIFLLLFFVILKKENKKGLLFLISCGLILGGALSNLEDRIFLGYVVDYLDFRVWPVFNLSDTCITIGAGLLMLQSFRKKTNP